MKYFIILALITLASAEWKLPTIQEFSGLQRSCDKRYKVSDELIEKAKTEHYPPIEVFQVVLCVLRGSEIWTDSEGFMVDRIMIGLEQVASKNDLNVNKLRESLTKCSDKNTEGSTALDWAYRCFKCFKDDKYLFDAIKIVKFYQQNKEEKSELDE